MPISHHLQADNPIPHPTWRASTFLRFLRHLMTESLLPAFLTTVMAAGLDAATAPELDQESVTAIHAQLDRGWKALDGGPRANQGVREVFAFGLEAAGSGWHPERLEQVYAMAARFQDRKPGSNTQGNLRWTFGETEVNDANAVEFTMQMAALTWTFYRERLTPPARDLLKELIGQAIIGIRAHKVKESYTNIFLMKAWNCIALGEGLDQPELAAEGYAMLARWLEFTASHGVCEFLSPTYTGVDLDSLGLITRWAGRKSGRADAQAALALMWSSLAANWFAPALRLGGAHSRDYDYLTGHGRVETHIQSAGWLSPMVATPNDALPPSSSVFWRLAQWTPPVSWRIAAAPEAPRIVVERFGDQPWERIVNYVGRHFSIGSAGATYGNMDKPVTMCFEGGGKVPMLNLFMDGRGDPYGNKHIAAGASHQKSLHLTPFLASVQSGPEVLVALVLDPAAKNIGHTKNEVNQLTTQLIFPVMDLVLIDGKPAPPEDVSLPIGATLVLVKSDVALGIRVLHARGDGGAEIPATLRFDGKDFGACRLAIVHATGKPTKRASTVLWLRATEGLNAAGITAFASAFAKAKSGISCADDTLSATAAGLIAPLGLTVDLARNERTALIGGESSAAALLMVNGKELGRPLLFDAPSLRTAR